MYLRLRVVGGVHACAREERRGLQGTEGGRR